MREFQAAVPGRLRAVSTGSKILYSAFAIAAVIGLLVSWRLYGAAVGDAGPAAYYAGAPAEVKAAEAAAPAGDGPALELPDEAAKPRVMVAQMPERKLLEVTHFHLFTIPIYVLVLGHLWLLAKIPVRVQHTGAALGVVTSGLHIAAPWIVRGHAGLAALMPISGVAMLCTLGVMAIVPMIDMWLPQPKARATSAETRKKRAAPANGAASARSVAAFDAKPEGAPESAPSESIAPSQES